MGRAEKGPTKGAPRWARRLLAWLAPSEREDEVVGDLEEAHRRRVERRGTLGALPLTTLETLDMAASLLRARLSGATFSALDVKLGLRMLVKHPSLTFLGGLSMAFAIFVGTVAFELVSQGLFPDVPLPEGDRIVALQLYDASTSRGWSRVLYDAGVWKEELRTVTDVTVYRDRELNLVTDDGRGEPVVVAQIEPEGFELAGEAPLLGRTLGPEDARPGASPVVVLGHGVWQGRFAGAPDIVGTDIRLGGTPTTVVGVMPEGFGFPVAHDMWMPLGVEIAAYQPGDGPTVDVLGRLAPGASLDDARSELAVHGRRMATAFPATHEHLRPQVVLWPRAVLGLSSLSTGLITVMGLTSNLPLLLFLLLVCGNVALLMFARATSRDGEILVRSALGASRTRIVAQLFAEALVLALAAAAVGLVAARYGLIWALGIIREELFEGEALPFWIQGGISLDTVAYAGLMAVLAAVVAGIWPGYRVTRSLGEGLRSGSAGGGGFRFGGVWTVVIAGQIVVTMLFPLVTFVARTEGQVELDYAPPFRLEEYVVAQVRAEEGAASESGSAETTAGRVAVLIEESLLGDPGVAGVTVAERLPMTYHPWNQVDVDGPSTTPPDERGHRVGSARVALDFFEVMGADLVAGRGFHSADLDEGANAIVVDDAFVERVLGGRNALGVQVRYRAGESSRDPTQEPGPWLRIVGVVEEIGARSFYGAGGIYHPARAEALVSPHLIVHLPSETAGFGSRLQSLGTTIDPAARLHGVQTLVEATSGPREFYAFWTTILVGVSGIALLLSLAGIYAVMSYTVAQRTREIGIRMALGSSRARVVTAVFRRPLFQVGLGLVSGFVLLCSLLLGLSEGYAPVTLFAGLVGYSLVMTVVCLTACATPTLRALRVEPGDALRVEG